MAIDEKMSDEINDISEFEIREDKLLKYIGNKKCVKIPNNIKTINSSAFASCSFVENIIIPIGVTEIETRAFADCTNLESITIPKSVTEIGRSAFKNTLWQKNRINENPLIIVNDMVIDGTFCFGRIAIPNNVKKITEYAFEGCTNLYDIMIPESVTEIGYNAFYNCYARIITKKGSYADKYADKYNLNKLSFEDFYAKLLLSALNYKIEPEKNIPVYVRDSKLYMPTPEQFVEKQLDKISSFCRRYFKELIYIKFIDNKPKKEPIDREYSGKLDKYRAELEARTEYYLHEILYLTGISEVEFDKRLHFRRIFDGSTGMWFRVYKEVADELTVKKFEKNKLQIMECWEKLVFSIICII